MQSTGHENINPLIRLGDMICTGSRQLFSEHPKDKSGCSNSTLEYRFLIENKCLKICLTKAKGIEI